LAADSGARELAREKVDRVGGSQAVSTAVRVP